MRHGAHGTPGWGMIVLAALAGVTAVELQAGSTPVAVQGAEPISATAAHRARGLAAGYNLDHAEALAAFDAAIATAPNDPAGYRMAAATTWTRVLFAQGAITVDDYLGQARSDLARPAPPPDLDRAFRRYLEKAIALGEARVGAQPLDADAHYQIGSAYGFQASYIATVEGRVSGSLGAARRAYREHERALELDPRRKDAGLIVGMYRYAVSELSLPKRWIAHLVGFGGGRARGLRLVEEAAAYRGDVQSNALFTLVVFYNREGRHDDALRVIAELQRRHPRNRLLWLEAAGTALRAGRAAEARTAIEAGFERLAQDSRPRAFGESARWQLIYGATLVALRDVEPAERALRRALAEATRDWVRGRAHAELGKLADLSAAREQSAEHYRTAERLCRTDHDALCATEARALLKKGYR